MEPSAVAAAMATLTLADLEDDDSVQRIDNVSVHVANDEPEFYAVGRLVTDKPVKLNFFRDTMASVWRPAFGLNVREIQPRRFLFRFFDEDDISRIIEDGPWTYEQNLLILQRITLDVDPELVALDRAEFWVQVHGLPAGLRSEAVLSAIGGFIGRAIKMDDRNFDGSMRVFFRVRIELEVAKPLKKGMRVKKDDGEWAKVDFKYERLPTFCFICGILGNGDRFCQKRPRGESATSVKSYGPELRAGNRRNIPVAGQKWVAPETVVERRQWAAPGARVDGANFGNNSQNISNDLLAMQVHGSLTETSHGKLASQHTFPKTKGISVICDTYEGGVTVGDQKRKRAGVIEGTADENDGHMDVDTLVPKNLLLAGAGSAQSRPTQ